MAYFENINSKDLLQEDEDYSFPPFTDKDLEETEKAIGWKLPKSYIALLKIRQSETITYEGEDYTLLKVVEMGQKCRNIPQKSTIAKFIVDFCNETQIERVHFSFFSGYR